MSEGRIRPTLTAGESVCSDEPKRGVPALKRTCPISERQSFHHTGRRVGKLLEKTCAMASISKSPLSTLGNFSQASAAKLGRHNTAGGLPMVARPPASETPTKKEDTCITPIGADTNSTSESGCYLAENGSRGNKAPTSILRLLGAGLRASTPVDGYKPQAESSRHPSTSERRDFTNAPPVKSVSLLSPGFEAPEREAVGLNSARVLPSKKNSALRDLRAPAVSTAELPAAIAKPVLKVPCVVVAPAVVEAKLAQLPTDRYGSPTMNINTPPDLSFDTKRQQLYKNAHTGTGRGVLGRGRGRGRIKSGGRGGKWRPSALVPGQGTLLGAWRTEREGNRRNAKQ